MREGYKAVCPGYHDRAGGIVAVGPRPGNTPAFYLKPYSMVDSLEGIEPQFFFS